MKIRLFISLFVSIPFLSLSQVDNIKSKQDSIVFYQNRVKSLENELEDLKLAKLRQDIKQLALPKIEQGEELVEHIAMCLVYSEKHEQAKWVAHIITPDIINGSEGRTNDFRPDSLIKTGSAIEQDYFIKTLKTDGTYLYDGFGYDRGHLAPSADFRWSQRALSESYYYSNISPQVGEFNCESWAKLEDMLRAYIYRNPTTQLLVVTGGVLHDNLPKITRGVNKVSIPEKYYKIAIDLQNKRAVAFLMDNKVTAYPHESYAVSIDELEKLTSIDFFPNLPDDLENELEAQKDAKVWLPMKEQEDVKPQDQTKLPRNTFNTVVAQQYADKNEKITVCGTVVSTKLSAKGHIFLNLDKGFPNQIFTIIIFKDNLVNFSYPPHEYLKGKKIYATGKVNTFNNVPSMVIENEKAIDSE